MDTSLLVLRGKIKGLAEEVIRLRKQTHTEEFTQLSKEEQSAEIDRIWRVKRKIGRETRLLNIAYGLLRGQQYRALERKCQTKPNVDEIIRIVNHHAGTYAYRHSREEVCRWLGVPERVRILTMNDFGPPTHSFNECRELPRIGKHKLYKHVDKKISTFEKTRRKFWNVVNVLFG